MNKSQMVGRAIALGAASFYGFNTTLSWLACVTGAPLLPLTIIRFAMAAVVLGIIVSALLLSYWRLPHRVEQTTEIAQ